MRSRTGRRAAGLTVLLTAVTPALAQGPPKYRLAVATVEQQVVPQLITVVGSVAPNRRSLLGTEIAGLVQELKVERGDHVKAGAVICQLRDKTARLEAQQAQGTLDSLQARLDELEAGTRKEELDRARAQMEEAKALLEKAQYEKERIDGLAKAGVATSKEINDTRADLAAARQRYEQAAADYELAKEGPRKEVIAAARFAVEAQKARVEVLEDQVDKTKIRAPFTGYVTNKHTEVGEWLTLGGAVVEIIELDPVLVRLNVPESTVQYAKPGVPVRIRIDALHESVTGAVANVIPQADEAARTFPVEVEVANPEGRLKAGMFARATVPAGRQDESLVVPKDAVIQRGGTDFVVGLAPGPTGLMAIPMPVQLGAEVGEKIAVSNPGLQPGMQVAIKGQERVYVPGPAEIVPPDVFTAEPPAGPPPTTQPTGPVAATATN